MMPRQGWAAQVRGGHLHETIPQQAGHTKNAAPG
jgi:hypothetical protein